PAFQVLGQLVVDGISVYVIDRVLLPPDKASPLPRQRTSPAIPCPMETSPALDPWLERLRRREADGRQGSGSRRVGTVARWIFRQVLVSRPPLSRRLGVCMTRRRLGDVERRRLDEAFIIMGLGALTELVKFHETLGVHTGASRLKLELERIAHR